MFVSILTTMSDFDINKACAKVLRIELRYPFSKESAYVKFDGPWHHRDTSDDTGALVLWHPLTDANQANLCRDELLKRGWQITHLQSEGHTTTSQILLWRDVNTFHKFDCHPDRFFAEALAWVQGELQY